MSNDLTFSEHKANMFKAISGMRKALDPLNKKLKPLNMMVWVDDGLVCINRHRANDRSGASTIMNDDRIERMMSMTDDQLKKELEF